jgi:hypothetical protein
VVVFFHKLARVGRDAGNGPGGSGGGGNYHRIARTPARRLADEIDNELDKEAGLELPESEFQTGRTAARLEVVGLIERVQREQAAIAAQIRRDRPGRVYGRGTEEA